jgi:Ca2+-transporting ATPase
MMALLLAMKNLDWFAGTGLKNPEFGMTTRQVSIFFAVYVFFQVWNQINCRSLTPRESGFTGMFRNRTFLMIVGTVAVVQIAITSVPVLAGVFKVEPLGVVDWLLIIAFTSSVLIFAEIARQLRREGGEPAPRPLPA